MIKHAGDDAPIRRRVNFQNIPVAIEYPAGSVKLGQDEQGNAWARVYLLDYGFIEGGPNSGDGETMDVYLGPHQSARYVYLVNQLTKQGEFDETKCMLGFASEEEAVQGYLRHYPEGWEKDRVQDVKTKTLEQFKAWLRGGETAKAASRTDKAWITPEGKILSVDDVAALEHAELVPAGIVTDSDATASALKAGWVRVGKFSPGLAYMEIGVPVTREVLHRVQTALTGTAYDTDRYMVDTPRRVGYLDREDMFASVSPERFVSRIQKVGSHKNKTAALCLRLWITPDAEVKEFPASWGHAGYAQRLFEAEDPPRNVLMGKAVDELENMKWARVGVWHQEMYISGRPLTDAQLHALQAHIAKDPSWQSPRSVVISSGGRDVTLSFDEFMALDHITDTHRHKLASRKDTVQKIKTFTTDEGTFSIWDVDANHRRPDMFTVWEHPEGWIVRNVLIPENLLRQGVATRTYTALNMLSLQATGHPLRSTQARTRLRGEQVLELSDEGRAFWDSLVSKGHAEPVGDTYRFKTSAMVTAVGRSPLQPWQMTRDQYLTAMEANKHLPSYEEPHRVSRRDTRHPWTVLETFEIEDYSATIEVSDEGGKSYAWDHTKGTYARDEHGDLVPHGMVYHKQVAAFIGDTRIGYAGDSFGAIEMFVAPKFQRYGVSTRLLHWYHRLYPNATSGGTTSAGYAFLREFHKKAVAKALREGKDVPENVLAEYPDLHATPRGTEQEHPVPERNPPTEHGPGSRDEDAPALPRMRKDYTDYKDLPSRAFSKDETIRMGADGMISTKAYLRYIRLDKIEGHEPMPHAEDMEFTHGTPITQPVEVWYDAETDTYMLYAGNHRVVQATYNGDSYILAFVQPDKGKIGSDATTSAAEAFPGLAGGQKAASVKLAALRKVTLKPTTLYHGTRASFNEAEEDLQGPAWVSDTLAVAKRFAGEQGRVIEYRLGSPVTVWKIESAQDLSRLAAKYGLDPDEVDHYELAETVDGGWIIPKNYQGPAAGADILLSDPTVLTYVQTHLPDGTTQVREQDENDADAMHKHAGSTANALLKEALGQSEHLGDAFHAWFKGSRIVDAKGQPLRVFHGTWKDFGQDGWFSEGQGGYIYVTPDPSYASTYSGDEGTVMSLYAHARNPLDLRGLGVGEVSQSRVIQALKQAGVTPPEALLRLRGLRPMFQWVKTQDFKEAVQAQGHDAIWIKERTSDAKGDALLLFDAKQLKSATGNRGTWDPEDARLIASRTASFESWFNGSKVVDSKGQPLKVYKGMWPYDWTKETETGKGPLVDTINRSTAFPSFDPTDTEPVHLAGFFASDPTVASHFAQDGAVYPVYLSIKNPYVIHAEGKPAGTFQFGPEGRPFRDAIRSGKYDGVFLLGTSDEGDVYVALRPNQIKSAVGNTGAFNPEDHRITAAAKEAAIPGLEGTKVLWDGKPLKVYHGTAAEFTEFKQDFVGQNFGDAAGFFFTNNTSHDAQWVQNPSDTGGMATRYDEHGVPVRPSDPRYNHLRVWEDDTSAGAYAMNSKGPGEAAIIPAYINLKNPLVIDKDLDGGGILSAIESRSQPAGTFIKNEVLGQGYDGLIVIDRDIQFKNGQPEILVVATRPDQIIPAIGKTASDEIGSGEHAATTDPTGQFWGEAGAGCVFVAKDTGRVLLPLRSEFVNEPHTWGVWGGAVDSHESPEVACHREIKEETGYTGPLTLTRAYVYRNGDFTYTTFLAHVPTEFTPKLNWETEDFKWCEPGEWPQPLHFGLKEALPSITGALPATPHHVEAAGGRVVDSPAFKAWFAGSEVVDKHGNPLVLYHGTASPDVAVFDGSSYSDRGPAGFFAYDPAFADQFASSRETDEQEMDAASGETTPHGPQIYPVYIKSLHLFDVNSPSHMALVPSRTAPEPHQAYTWLEEHVHDIWAAGFDAYIDYENGSTRPATGIAVKSPHQIKSAIGNNGNFDPTNPRITAAIIDEGTSHEAHPEGHQASTSNGPEGLTGEPHAAGRSSAVGRGGESADASEASGPQAEVWESTEVAARLRLEGWGFTRHVAHSPTILLSFNADDTLCAVSVHDPIPGRVTNQGMPIQSWAACISVPPTGYRASKRAASRLDLPPIKWATPTDAELLNEISTEYSLEELFLLPTWPTKDDMAAAVPDMKACSQIETLDPSKIAGRHLWDSYEALKRTVTNFGGPKDPDSMVEAIKAGRPLPMPVVLHKRDGSYEVAGGNTRAGIAALAHQPIQAFVVDAAKAGQRMADKLIADAEAEWHKDDPALFDAVKAYYMANGPKPVITPDQGFAAYHLSATFGLALRQLGIDSEGKDVRLRPTLEAALVNPHGPDSQSK